MRCPVQHGFHTSQRAEMPLFLTSCFTLYRGLRGEEGAGVGRAGKPQEENQGAYCQVL